MGIADSPDIFQSKMSDLLESLDYVQAYLDDFLCISRNSLEDHLENLTRYSGNFEIRASKSTLTKMTFCALEIEYLGYHTHKRWHKTSE
jgi:hypothetical protein